MLRSCDSKSTIIGDALLCLIFHSCHRRSLVLRGNETDIRGGRKPLPLVHDSFHLAQHNPAQFLCTMAASFVTDSAKGLFNTIFRYGSEATVDQSGDKSFEPAGKLGGKTVWIVNVVTDEWVWAPSEDRLPTSYTVVAGKLVNSNTKDETAFNSLVQSGVVEVQVDLETRRTPDVPVQLMNKALCFLERELSALKEYPPSEEAFKSARRLIQSHLTCAAAQCLRERSKHAADNKDGSWGDIPIFIAPHEITPQTDVNWSDKARMTAPAIIHESDVRRAEDGDLTLLLDADNGVPQHPSDITGKSTLRFEPEWSDRCEGIYRPLINCNLVEDHLKDPTALPALKALQHLLWQTSCPASGTEFPQELKTIEQEEIRKQSAMTRKNPQPENMAMLRYLASEQIEKRSVEWLWKRFESLLSRDAETSENSSVLANFVDFSGSETAEGIWS